MNFLSKQPCYHAIPHRKKRRHQSLSFIEVKPHLDPVHSKWWPLIWAHMLLVEFQLWHSGLTIWLFSVEVLVWSPGPVQWVKYPALLQLWLTSVPPPDTIPGPGTSMCHGCGWKRKKESKRETPWEDCISSHYVLGAVDDLDIVKTVGFPNSSFSHQTTKKVLELKSEFSKISGTKSIHKNRL